MDNQKVRAHLRKGELAVNLLVGLGFTYDENAKPPKWVAPSSFVDMEEARKEMQAVLDKYCRKEVAPDPFACEEIREAPVKVGDTFTILRVPAGHALAKIGYSASKVRTIKGAEYLEQGSEAAKRVGRFGWIVRFDFHSVHAGRQVLWLPLSCIKVRRC